MYNMAHIMLEPLFATGDEVAIKDFHSSLISTGESGRSWVDVRRRDRVVDVDQNAGVCGTVGPGESSEVRRLGASSASDSNLTARKVELGGALALRYVQRDVLVAHQVVPSRNALRNGHGDGGLACADDEC